MHKKHSPKINTYQRHIPIGTIIQGSVLFPMMAWGCHWPLSLLDFPHLLVILILWFKNRQQIMQEEQRRNASITCTGLSQATAGSDRPNYPAMWDTIAHPKWDMLQPTQTVLWHATHLIIVPPAGSGPAKSSHLMECISSSRARAFWPPVFKNNPVRVAVCSSQD